MRNFIYTLLGTLGLVLLSLPAMVPVNDAAGKNSDHKGMQAFWSTVLHVPTKSVSEEEKSAPSDNRQDQGSQAASEQETTDESQQDAATAPGVSKQEPMKKKVKIDLSDLVLRPV